MNARRLLTGGLVLGAVGLCLLPVASSAATAPTALTPTVEAWYQPNPLCLLLPACEQPGLFPVPLEVPASSPYPAGTLHVGYAAGKETARSYLALPTEALPTEVEKAVLTVPLDTAVTSGNLAPETAHVQACLVTGDIVPVQGSVLAVPTVSCDDGVLLTYVATPTPHLEGDLTPMAKGLRTTSGIALLPDATKVTPADAWHVTFSAHDRVGFAPATLAVSLAGGPVTTPSPVATPTSTASQAPLGGGLTPPLGSSGGDGLASTPGLGGAGISLPSIAPAPAGLTPEVAAPITDTLVRVQDVALPETVTFGYAYPAVWLLPFVFLIGVPAVARALTKDLTVSL